MKKLALLIVLATAGVASASPRVLPFTYPYETPAADSLEVEQYVDMIPVRVARELDDGTTDAVYSTRFVLNTELEYAVTDRLELALYATWQQGASSDTPFIRFQGLKQRARYRIAERDELPIDIAVYLEVAEFHNEIELEEKLILAKRFGKLSAHANLWVEQEYYWQVKESKFIYNPTIGLAYELSPRFSAGLEYWVRGRFDARTDANDLDPQLAATLGTVHYVGPTFLAQKGRIFFSVGAYVRADKLTSSAVAGDQFGKMWIRTIVGLDL
jgi:hypothetical protein